MTHGGEAGFQVAIDCREAGETRVRLEGELDIASCARLRQVLLALLEDGLRVVVDLARLRFLDVPGVRVLVEVAAAAASRQVPFALEHATGQVARLLALTSGRAPLPLVA